MRISLRSHRLYSRILLIFIYYFWTNLNAETIPIKVEQALQLELDAIGFMRELVNFKQHTDDLYYFQAGIYSFQISNTGLAMHGDVWENAPKGLEFKHWRKQITQATIAALKPEQLISYLPDNGIIHHQIHIFTDVTCPYSRQLHTELPLLLDAGIAVHYLAFPRSGDNSLGAKKMQAIWCHATPTKAFDYSVESQRFGFKLCQSPVAQQFQLGFDLGLIGTPSLIFDDGTISTGYNSAIDIIAYLDDGIPLPSADFSEVYEPSILEDKRPDMPPSNVVINALEAALKQAKLTQINIDNIDILPDYSGMYIALVGAYVYYISTDGHIGVRGERLNLADWQPTSTQQRQEIRRQSIAMLDPSSLIDFNVDQPQSHIYLFIDPNSIISQQYLRQIDQLNRANISVHLLAFPQTGDDSENARQLARIWCAEQPKQALFNSNSNATSRDCQTTISAHYALARSLGIDQAAAILYDDGSLDTDAQNLADILAKAVINVH